MQKAKVYKGIYYIRISELPEDQQVQIKNIDSKDLIIKILTDTELMSDCVAYADYQSWFQNIYTRVSPAQEEEKVQEPQKASVFRKLKHRLLPDT